MEIFMLAMKTKIEIQCLNLPFPRYRKCSLVPTPCSPMVTSSHVLVHPWLLWWPRPLTSQCWSVVRLTSSATECRLTHLFPTNWVRKHHEYVIVGSRFRKLWRLVVYRPIHAKGHGAYLCYMSPLCDLYIILTLRYVPKCAQILTVSALLVCVSSGPR